MQFIELDLGNVKQIHFDNDDIMVFLLNRMGKCMPFAQGIKDAHAVLSLHETDKAPTLFCGDGGAGRRFDLATNASFVLP